MTLIKPANPVYILGPSLYLPPKVVTNDELITWMNASFRPSWIEKRTGINTRHWVTPEVACSDLATYAANNLFELKKIDPCRIGVLNLATTSGDYIAPPTAPLVQHKLGLNEVGSYDLSAACAGFISGLLTSQGLLNSIDKDILLIASEIRSKFLNHQEFQTSVLFGDGAAAVMLSKQSNGADFKLIAGNMLTDGSVADIISIPTGGSKNPTHLNLDGIHTLKMRQGAELFVKALEGMYKSSEMLLQSLNLTINDIDYIVPHQANLHMIEGLVRKFNFPMERVVQTVKKWGNTSGASVGMALHELKFSGNFDLKAGNKILLISAGGGGLAANAVLEALN
ncbi:MAG: ketoacyl-ACP synthase III [Bacteriovoracaceae bacterium]